MRNRVAPSLPPPDNVCLDPGRVCTARPALKLWPWQTPACLMHPLKTLKPRLTSAHTYTHTHTYIHTHAHTHIHTHTLAPPPACCPHMQPQMAYACAPRQLANSLWAASKLQYRPPPLWLSRALAGCHRRMPQFEAQVRGPVFGVSAMHRHSATLAPE